jgi:hypothetical protein
MQSARSLERTAWGGAQQTRGRNRQCVCSVCARCGVCRVRAVGWRGGWVGVTHRRRRVFEKVSLCSVKGK